MLLNRDEKKKLITNISECGQSALKDFVTKIKNKLKLKKLKCNGGDGTIKTVPLLNSFIPVTELEALQKPNHHKTRLTRHGLGLPGHQDPLAIDHGSRVVHPYPR